MNMEMVCIVCPVGCRMQVEEQNGEVRVSGNTCARGKIYAVDEFKCPKRVLTTSVSVKGGQWPLVSVKTKESIPKEKLDCALDEIAKVIVNAPVKIGDVIIGDVARTGVAVIATRNVDSI